MTDNSLTAPNPQTDATQSAAQEEPKYITAEELERRLAEVKKEALDAQSRMGKRIQQKIDALRKAGVPEADEKMATALIEAEEAQAEGTQQPEQQAVNLDAKPQSIILATANEWIKADGLTDPDPVTRDAYIIMATEGVRLQDGDPETQMVVSDKSVEEFIQSVKQAVQAKKARLSAPKISSIPAFAKGAPGGAPPHTNLSARETLENYFKTKPV